MKTNDKTQKILRRKRLGGQLRMTEYGYKRLIACLIALLIAITAVTTVLAVKYKKQSEIDEPAFESSETQTQAVTKAKTFDYKTLSLSLTRMPDREVSEELLKNFDAGIIEKLEAAVKSGEVSDEEWLKITGLTYKAAKDKFITHSSIDMGDNGKDFFELGFTGDINFTNSGYVMTHARTKPNGVIDCIDETFRNEMLSVDILLVNNEFPYSDRGSPTPDKTYTFRADPETVGYMTNLGVDIVSLANNHAYDYGYDSFIDTISTLKKEGIPYVGAGMNKNEAAKPVTFLINGCKVGYVASSGVESPIYTPVATDTEAGIMGSYDNGKAMIEAIGKAKKECDIVIAYPHWGYENTTELTAAQKRLGKEFIDAGADAVVGNHSHCLQGIEFYNGSPIIYSLGNFWFNTKSVPTAMMKLKISGGGIQVSYIPGMQSGSETYFISDAADRRKLYDDIISWSPDKAINIDDNGVITPK